LGKQKAFKQKKKNTEKKIWDDEIKFYNTKNIAFKKHLQTKIMDNDTEYKHRRAIAKT